MNRDRRFECVMTDTDFVKLDHIAQTYSMSKAAVIRLAVDELYHKLQSAASRSQTVKHPILQPQTENPPPEMDEFWTLFRG